MTQIPIYRSLELDTANEVMGYYVKEKGYYLKNNKPDLDKPCTRHYIISEYGERYEIAPEYLKEYTQTQRLEEFLLEKEKQGYDISSLSNTAIVLLYYNFLGIASTISMQEWLTRVADGVVPPYPSITRAIRKCRELNPRWRKHNKKEQVEKAKKKIDYSSKRSEREGEK